jgi:hypothetical protein
MKAELDQTAENIAVNIGVDAAKLKPILYRQADMMLRGATSGEEGQGIGIAGDRIESIMQALKGGL